MEKQRGDFAHHCDGVVYIIIIFIDLQLFMFIFIFNSLLANVKIKFSQRIAVIHHPNTHQN